jgi:hypothetical protein
MPELAAFQRNFAAEIDRPIAAPSPLRVYRNTVLLGALDALTASFPVTRMILGDEAFETLALAFARRHPPEAPILALYGSAFPEWLSHQPIARELEYIADVARCEELRNAAMNAADAPALTTDALTAFDPEQLLTLKLRAHPATRFAWFPTPAMAIWLAHQDEIAGEIAPHWRSGGAIFTRPGTTVTGFELDSASHRLLVGMRMGETLGAASLAVSQLYPDVAIGKLFGLLVQRGTFAALPH